MTYCTAEQYLTLVELHNNADKATIVANIKDVARFKGIKHLNEYLMEVLSLNKNSVYQRMSLSDVRIDSKFSLEQMCKIAIKFNVDIVDLYKEVENPKQRARRDRRASDKYNDIIKLRDVDGMTFYQLGEHYGVTAQRAEKVYKHRKKIDALDNN